MIYSVVLGANMSNKVILKAEDLDGYLTSEDMAELKTLDEISKRR